MWKKIMMLFWGIWAGAGSAPGQETTYLLEHYRTEEGLAHDEILCLLKDREGFLWLGTSGGLNRFDGRRFETFRHTVGDSLSLPNNQVTGLAQDDSGLIWITTGKGLCRLDPVQRSFHRIQWKSQHPEHSPNKIAHGITIDKKGYGWFIAGPYLGRINLTDEQCRFFPFPLQETGEGKIFIDGRQRIWVTILGNLYQFDPQRLAFRFYFGRDASTPDHRFPVVDFCQGKEDTLWVSTWGNGFYYYDQTTDSFIDYPDGPHISTCFIQDQDRLGRSFFWTGGGPDGLYLWSFEEQRSLGMPPDPLEPFSHNGAMAKDILKDEQTGIVWIATERGLEKYDPFSVRFNRVLLPPGDRFAQFSFVSSVLQDRLDPSGQTFWIAVWGNGLYRWNRQSNTFRHFTDAQGLTSNETFSVIQDRQGRIWIGCYLGVDIYDPETGRWDHIRDFFTKPNVTHKVLSLLEDRKGNIWIGCNYEGLFRYDPATRRLNRLPLCDAVCSDMGANRISKIVEDAQSNVWVSTYNGLFRIDGPTGVVERIEGEGFLAQRYIGEDVALGREDDIWLAARGGLVRLDLAGKILSVFTEASGLRSDLISRIVVDQQGMLWVGTSDQLHRLDPRTGRMLYFSKADGLFADNQLDAFNLTEDGELFIGAQHAFNFFRPSQLPLNRRPPQMVFTAVKVLNRHRDWKSKSPMVLGPRENVITIEFSALQFSQPEKIRYAYRLEGFDKEWIWTDQPSATYTNLEGGTYTFRVRSANNDGVWNTEDLRLFLQVKAPFQKTLTFFLLLALLASGLVGTIWWYRTQQQRQLETIRNRIARDLHDDMGSTLSSIRFFSEFAQSRIKEDQTQVASMLDRISHSATALSEAMQDIIWTIHTRNDQLEDLLIRIREFGLRALETKQIRFVVQVSERFESRRLTIAQRRNLFLIFKEAINNALKYAECSEVRLFMTVVRHRLRMIIEDNGKGFELQVHSTGHGLKNMQNRAEEIGGVLRVWSEPGRGTRVEITFPLGTSRWKKLR